MEAFKIEKPEQSLRTTSSRQEITAILMEAMIQKIKITLWQVINGKREIIEGHIIGLEDEISILLATKNNQNFTFNEKMTLYLHGFHRNILFKQEVLSYKDNLLVLKIPKEIKLHELRKNARYYYQYEEGMEFEFECPEWEKKSNVIVTLMDVSKGGAGIAIPESRVNLFPKGKLFKVKRISQQKIASDLMAEVVYTRVWKKRKLNNQSLYTVGLRFNKDLFEIVYHPTHKHTSDLDDHRRRLIESANKDRDVGSDGKIIFHGYSKKELEGILSNLNTSDLPFAESIRNNQHYLSVIKNMRPEKKQLLLREWDLVRLAMALRLCEKDLIQSLLSVTSEITREEVYQYLQRPQNPRHVKLAQDELISYLRSQENKK